jgi:hypothetical protein
MSEPYSPSLQEELNKIKATLMRAEVNLAMARHRASYWTRRASEREKEVKDLCASLTAFNMLYPTDRGGDDEP